MGYVLITGASGQLGQSLSANANSSAHSLKLLDRSELDLSDPSSIRNAFHAREYVGVINTGAYTAVDRAELEPEKTWAVNAAGPALLAAGCEQRSIPLIQISTDYVYSGTKDEPYREGDPIGPLSVYGASKAAGEMAVMASRARAVIARTSWIVSPFGSNFVKTMLKLGKERDELRVVSDQFGAPTSADDLAIALLRIMDRLITDPSAPTGTYHVTNSGETTWYGVAQEIFETAILMGQRTPRLVPITTEEYPMPARRPSNSRLSGERLKADFGIQLAHWKTSLGPVVRRSIELEASKKREIL
ncbi:MAG TPA: dTDP-4-dehydrorhamnose reductase [Oculatellaceae cyanobacterium]